MKKLLFLLLIVISSNIFAQKIDYDKIILPDNADYIPMDEKLVRLAWKNNPQSEILEHQYKKEKEDIPQARREWADDVRATFNINENNIDQSAADSENNVTLLPRYNFGVSFSLGSFLTTPSKVRQAKEDVKIAELNMNSHKLAVRAEVLRRYRNYLMKLEILKLKTQANEDAYSSYLSVSQKFKKGEVSLEDLNSSTSAYNKTQEEKIISDKEVYDAKISVEEIIGIKLEDIE